MKNLINLRDIQIAINVPEKNFIAKSKIVDERLNIVFTTPTRRRNFIRDFKAEGFTIQGFGARCAIIRVKIKR
jgi:hypothetical protein